MVLEIRSGSAGQTAGIALALARALRAGDVLALDGELGAGKTVMVAALARALGHDGPVRSPTFTIINVYRDISLCHVDAYRLDGADELVEAGVEEYLDGGWICAVEWADRVRAALPGRTLDVAIRFGEGEDDRLVAVTPRGDWGSRTEEILSELRRHA